jgi:hypothetical protein
LNDHFYLKHTAAGHQSGRSIEGAPHMNKHFEFPELTEYPVASVPEESQPFLHSVTSKTPWCLFSMMVHLFVIVLIGMVPLMLGVTEHTKFEIPLRDNGQAVPAIDMSSAESPPLPFPTPRSWPCNLSEFQEQNFWHATLYHAHYEPMIQRGGHITDFRSSDCELFPKCGFSDAYFRETYELLIFQKSIEMEFNQDFTRDDTLRNTLGMRAMSKAWPQHRKDPHYLQHKFAEFGQQLRHGIVGTFISGIGSQFSDSTQH